MNTRDTHRVLQAVAREHLPEEINLLPGILRRVEKGNRPIMKPKTKLFAAVLLVLLVFAVVLVSIPGAASAMKRLFGYIPNVGVVEQGTPIRVLAEPVTVTRDGISVTVTSAMLTSERTHVTYRIFGVPGSAYPHREDIMGCIQQEYLRLPDGTKITSSYNDYQPIPAGINEAVFVMPCIINTLPGTVPTDWELQLKFIPAPPDLTMMPVIDVATPIATPISTPQQSTQAAGASTQPGPSPQQSAQPTTYPPITVLKEIETPDGYILAIQLPFKDRPGVQGLPNDDQVQFSGGGEIRDAKGKKVNYNQPMDLGPNELGLDPSGSYWLVQFNAAGLAYPLSISFSGNKIQQVEPGATAEFSFDAGSNPQMGQEWKPDQEIQFAGRTFRLTTIRADSRNGYSFNFQCDPDMVSADFEILGYTAVGWGGGGGCYNGKFERHLSYQQYPTGVLTIRMSNLVVLGDPITLEGQWSPAKPRTDIPVNPTPIPGLCLSSEKLEQLETMPAEMSSGKALFFESLEGGDQAGLILYNLDGTHKQVLTSTGNWGAFSPDGKKVVYSAQDDTQHIVDVDTGAEQILTNASGFDPHWSPDGKQIAYIALGGGIIDNVFIVDISSGQTRQVSTLSYESIAGWSPDGARLYFTAPYTGGAAWKVYVFDLASGATQELFTIENGTPKFLNPSLSPDGLWIAYRGRDNSSVYLVRTDGSDMHLMLDIVGAGRLEWSASGWLGVNLMGTDEYYSPMILLKPDGCQAYRVPGQHGELEGLFVP